MTSVTITGVTLASVTVASVPVASAFAPTGAAIQVVLMGATLR
jgi:hypothetical protein